MTVRDLIDNLEEVEDKNKEVLVTDSGVNILEGYGCEIDKILDIRCPQDKDTTKLFIITK